MWFFYLLVIIGSTQADSFSAQSDIRINGSGRIVNGRTSLNIHVEIGNSGGTGTVLTQRLTNLPTGTGRPQTETPTGTGRPQTGSTTEQGTGAGEFNKEEKSALDAHNKFRHIHQAPPMTLNRQMCDEAKTYAEKLAAMATLKHSSNDERRGQGENLSMGCSTRGPQSMEQAVTNWYNEICDPGYNFASGGFSSGTGHFTQVVWKGSTELGIGRAESTERSMKCAYIVGRYKPAGNMMGDFPENVFKGSFDEKYCNSVKNDKPTKPNFFVLKEGGAINENRVAKVDVPEVPGPSRSVSRFMRLMKKKNFVGSSRS